VVTAAGLVGSPSISVGGTPVTVTPTAVDALALVGTPVITVAPTVTPTSVVAAALVGNPTIDVPYVVTPTSVVAAMLVGSATIKVAPTVTPTSVLMEMQVGSPSVSDGSSPGTPAAVLSARRRLWRLRR
jgi:2-keto-3-deoxy-6-phosphogluconate aldolase